MVSVDSKPKSKDNKSNERKEKIRNRRKKRQTIIIPSYSGLKTIIIESIIKEGKMREYFAYDDVFADLINKLNIDLNDIKKLKALYSYINTVMMELEDNGFVRGYHMPGQRRVFWKLIRSPVNNA